MTAGLEVLLWFFLLLQQLQWPLLSRPWFQICFVLFTVSQEKKRRDHCDNLSVNAVGRAISGASLIFEQHSGFIPTKRTVCGTTTLRDQLGGLMDPPGQGCTCRHGFPRSIHPGVKAQKIPKPTSSRDITEWKSSLSTMEVDRSSVYTAVTRRYHSRRDHTGHISKFVGTTSCRSFKPIRLHSASITSSRPS